MNNWIAILGIVVMFFISNQSTFAQEQRQCIPNQICVMPHDYLKYGYNDNFTRIITFGDFIDASTIKVTNTGYDEKSTTTVNYVLNFKNGILTYSNGTQSEFYFIMPIPIDSKNIDISYVNESINFNGFNRDTFGMHINNATHVINSNIDKETGIKMNYDSRISLAAFGKKDLWMGYSLKLLDTNMITSSTSPSIQQNTVPEFPFAIPILLISITSFIIFYRIKFRKLT